MDSFQQLITHHFYQANAPLAFEYVCNMYNTLSTHTHTYIHTSTNQQSRTCTCKFIAHIINKRQKVSQRFYVKVCSDKLQTLVGQHKKHHLCITFTKGCPTYIHTLRCSPRWSPLAVHPAHFNVAQLGHSNSGPQCGKS